MASPVATAILPRNFTLTTEERLRALAAGPPPFALRLRRIEDLEAAILKSIAEVGAEGGALPPRVVRDLERLNRLIDDHNRYYPIEARLPTDVRSGKLMDWGEPSAPRPPVTAEALVLMARGDAVRR